jgi:hypothetical protein
VPSRLKELQIWLPFRTSPRPSGGVNKIPYNRHGRKAKYTDPAEWMSFNDALKQMRKGRYAGLGIVVSKEMGLLAIDFDHCISNGTLDGSVELHVADLNTYAEISFSGDGLHAIACAALPWKANRRENSCVEMYDDRRFFVVTGNHLQGSPDEIVENQTAVDRLHLQVFGQQQVAPDSSPRQHKCDTITSYYTEGGEKREEKEPALHAAVLYPDEIVLAAVRTDVVARKYFEDGTGNMNPSGADFALACKLAFYTAKNYDQVRRLFLLSALMREKTLSARGDSDYLDMTLHKAVSKQKACWAPKTRSAKQAGPVGRRPSVSTVSVRELHARCPELNSVEISRQLDITPANVRQILSREARKAAADCSQGIRETLYQAPAVEDLAAVDRPALMSCPRSVRHLYPKPEGWIDTPEPVAPDYGVIGEIGEWRPRRKPAAQYKGRRSVWRKAPRRRARQEQPVVDIQAVDPVLCTPGVDLAQNALDAESIRPFGDPSYEHGDPVHGYYPPARAA